MAQKLRGPLSHLGRLLLNTMGVPYAQDFLQLLGSRPSPFYVAPRRAAAEHVRDPFPDSGTIRWIEEMIRNLAEQRGWRKGAKKIRIQVVFDNIHAGKEGKVSDKSVQALVNTLNESFAATPFEFFLAKVDRTNNSGSGC